jgi:hypothetical protein
MKLYMGELDSAETEARFPHKLFKSKGEMEKYFFGEFANNEDIIREADYQDVSVEKFLHWCWEDYFYIEELELDI